MNVGLLHPGAMGASIGAALRASGHEVFWVAAGRSAETGSRASDAGLTALPSLRAMLESVPVVLSVCPPHGAEALAQRVFDQGFSGLYADFNAISPARAQHIAGLAEAAGCAFVDGGLCGPPAWNPGTWLFLSGPPAHRVADLFSDGPLAVEVLDDVVGHASGLKLSYACITKGYNVMLLTALVSAQQLGVREQLQALWQAQDPQRGSELTRQVTAAARKGWRFSGEMAEIGRMLRDLGLPDGALQAAAAIYRSLADFKDDPQTPAIEAVLARIAGAAGQSSR